jgi:hypothetical protein
MGLIFAPPTVLRITVEKSLLIGSPRVVSVACGYLNNFEKRI